MLCEMCGSSGAKGRAIVEGVTLNVCDACGKFGTLLKVPTSFSSSGSSKVQKQAVKVQIPEEVVVPNIGVLVRSSRESRGLTQKEFAGILGVKESFLRSVESGGSLPDISTARRWERVLGSKCVGIVTTEGNSGGVVKGSQSSVTIGDLMKR